MKEKIISVVAEQHDLSKTEATAIYNTIRDVFMNTVSELAVGEHAILFGKVNLTKKVRPARNGRNPKTGESITIPESVVLDIKATPSLRKAG